jgi:hypothetical protein
MTFLYVTSESELSGQSECTNSQDPILCGETSYIKLILAKLFTVVTDERETVQKSFFFFFFFLQELNVNFEGKTLNISRRKFITCQKTRDLSS